MGSPYLNNFVWPPPYHSKNVRCKHKPAKQVGAKISQEFFKEKADFNIIWIVVSWCTIFFSEQGNICSQKLWIIQMNLFMEKLSGIIFYPINT